MKFKLVRVYDRRVASRTVNRRSSIYKEGIITIAMPMPKSLIGRQVRLVILVKPLEKVNMEISTYDLINAVATVIANLPYSEKLTGSDLVEIVKHYLSKLLEKHVISRLEDERIIEDIVRQVISNARPSMEIERTEREIEESEKVQKEKTVRLVETQEEAQPQAVTTIIDEKQNMLNIIHLAIAQLIREKYSSPSRTYWVDLTEVYARLPEEVKREMTFDRFVELMRDIAREDPLNYFVIFDGRSHMLAVRGELAKTMTKLVFG